MFDFEGYNREWIVKAQNGEPAFNDASNYGVTVFVTGGGSAPTDRVIGIHHLTGDENRGNHHIYVDVLDIRGNRQNLARLELRTEYNYLTHAIVDKPLDESGTNFPMWDFGAASIRVVYDDADPKRVASDTAAGIHFRHNDEGPYNTWGHHSFYVCFMRMALPAPPLPPVPPGADKVLWNGDIGLSKHHFYTRTPIAELETLLDAKTKVRVTRWNDE